MGKLVIFLLAIALIAILGYFAFGIAIILLKALIGVGVLAFIVIGIFIGRASKQ